MSTTTPPLELSPDEQAAIADITRTKVERNELRSENSRLRATLDEMQREIDFLHEQLRIAEHKRDMFQRHAVALFTRMTDIVPAMRHQADAIARALHEARNEASSGNAEAPSQTLTAPQPRDLAELDSSIAQVVSNLKGDVP